MPNDSDIVMLVVLFMVGFFGAITLYGIIHEIRERRFERKKKKMHRDLIRTWSIAQTAFLDMEVKK